MMCFSIFNKDKSRNEKRASRSAPELRNQSKLDNSALSQTRTSSRSLPSPRSIPELYKKKEHNLRVFSLQELRDATHGFNKLLKIGEGGFGSVYKGTISPLNAQGQPIVVAIKKLNTQGLQGHKEWLAEVQFLGVVNHPNLVKLLGYCSVDSERGIHRLLVYEFMPNRSLEDHLFKRTPTLPWKTRLEIMLGAAQGLAYLHDGLEVKVIYRDFKSSNVLLDESFKPKLSDFGLAREGPTGDRTHVSTAVVGTYGYAAPEYVKTGHLTIQSDIWTFGVVLYEILTGRRAVERNRPISEQKLLDWVKQFPPDGKKFGMIIDPRIRNGCSFVAAQKVGKLANSCLNKNGKERPTMSRVVESLKQVIQESEQGSSSVNKQVIQESEQGSSSVNKQVIQESEQGSSSVNKQVIQESEQGSSSVSKQVIQESEQESSSVSKQVIQKSEQGSSSVSKQVIQESEQGSSSVNKQVIQESEQGSSSVNKAPITSSSRNGGRISK